jgi:hypothetical protein
MGRKPNDYAINAQADANGAKHEPQAESPLGDGLINDPVISGVSSEGQKDGNLENKNQEKPAPNLPPEKEGEGKTKKRIKNPDLKGETVIVGNEEVQADANGVIEVDAAQAVRLLTIPGWEEA